jgi:hypothetical protein
MKYIVAMTSKKKRHWYYAHSFFGFRTWEGKKGAAEFSRPEALKIANKVRKQSHLLARIEKVSP